MSTLRVDVVLAWPRRHVATVLHLEAGATVADALQAADMPMEGVTGYAIFGERVTPETALRDGDRLELLRPLQADPKDARRRRAVTQRTQG